MLRYFICCIFLYVEVLASSKIVNGTDAAEGEFPYVVSLRRNSSHTCGGTILNENYVLTAAHCVCDSQRRFLCMNNNQFSLTCTITKAQKANLFSIQYDMLNITEDPVNTIDVKQIHCHKFNSNSLIYDAAVLELETPIPKGKWTPVKLSQEFVGEKEQTGTIVGWGRTSHGGPIAKTLQKMQVEIFDEKTCGKKYDNTHHICFGAPIGGACNGDSGTALLVDGTQVGIASFITEKCGTANEEYPNVYSKVATYHKWITETAKLN